MTRIRARSGEFEPDPGHVGAEITVAPLDGSEVTGQVQYPHPQGPLWRWVSFSDRLAPVPVQFAKGNRRYGYEGGRP